MSGNARSWRPVALGAASAVMLVALAVTAWQQRDDRAAPGLRAGAAPLAASLPDATAAAAARAPRPAASAAPIEFERLGRRRPGGPQDAAVRDAFAPRAWDLPAPATGAVGRPAGTGRQAAEPPPLPFEFLGRYEAGDQPSVLLLADERIRVVSPGEVIDGAWRIERLGAEEIEITHLPTRTKQTMKTGE
jgi:hypothetical protein